MAMSTSAANAPWPFDVRISDLQSAGLSAPSVVRFYGRPATSCLPIAAPSIVPLDPCSTSD
jgi:hypothetical protein